MNKVTRKQAMKVAYSVFPNKETAELLLSEPFLAGKFAKPEESILFDWHEQRQAAMLRVCKAAHRQWIAAVDSHDCAAAEDEFVAALEDWKQYA